MKARARLFVRLVSANPSGSVNGPASLFAVKFSIVLFWWFHQVPGAGDQEPDSSRQDEPGAHDHDTQQARPLVTIRVPTIVGSHEFIMPMKFGKKSIALTAVSQGIGQYGERRPRPRAGYRGRSRPVVIAP